MLVTFVGDEKMLIISILLSLFSIEPSWYRFCLDSLPGVGIPGAIQCTHSVWDCLRGCEAGVAELKAAAKLLEQRT